VLNGARYLRECLASVRGQDYPELEHVVADGGSTDGTLELLGAFPSIRVLPGPDQGIYEGINRAFAASRGEIIGILNADDCYTSGVLREVAESFEDRTVMAVFGGAVIFGDLNPEGRTLANEQHEPWYMATLGSPIINAWFFRRAVFERLGKFSTRYRIAADREFLLRFALAGLSYKETHRVCCRYREHEASRTFRGNDTVWRSVLHEHHAMTKDFLKRPDLGERARGLLRRARSRDALQGALYCAERGQMRELWRHAAAGLSHDPFLPMRLAAGAARRILKPRAALSR